MVSLTETVEQFAFAHKEMDRVHGELSTLRTRITELEAENARLVKQMQAMAKAHKRSSGEREG